MSYFAKVENTVVFDVIAADQQFIDSGAVGDPSLWLLTDFYTRAGVHYGADGKPDGGIPFRGNYAAIGGTYNLLSNVFYAKQPYPSWIISAPNWTWKAPVPMPTTGGPYVWDEATLSWVIMPVKES